MSIMLSFLEGRRKGTLQERDDLVVSSSPPERKGTWMAKGRILVDRGCSLGRFDLQVREP